VGEVACTPRRVEAVQGAAWAVVRQRRAWAPAKYGGARGLGEQGSGMAVLGAVHGPIDQGLASACGPSGPWRGDGDAGAGARALERQSANPT
jgi:hypothetical protein